MSSNDNTKPTENIFLENGELSEHKKFASPSMEILVNGKKCDDSGVVEVLRVLGVDETENNERKSKKKPKHRRHKSSDSVESLGSVVEESIRLSQHGRLRVRAATKTFATPANTAGDDIEAIEDISSDEESRKGHPRRPSAIRLETQTQYRLSADTNGNTFLSRLSGIVGISTSDGIYEDANSNNDGCHICGFAPNRAVIRYLHWTFRNSFWSVFFSFSFGFFGCTLFFACIIMAAGYEQPKCVVVNDQNFAEDINRSFFQDFGDAYSLSWTTFSTVGYGLIFPATSSTYSKVEKCTGIFILCTLESFVGILFSSFCGAIVYGKVARLRSHAQVVFSDAVVVRYGNGVTAGNEESASNGINRQENDRDENELPLPILEFRIANLLSNALGGEIMDCSMNIVASIDESLAGVVVHKAAKRRRKRRGKFRPTTPMQMPKLRQLDEEEVYDSEKGAGKSSKDKLKIQRENLDKIENLAEELRKSAAKHHQAFEEDLSGNIAPRRIFAKLEVETPDHPFFKRVWTVRHTLDAESPILCEKAKKMVQLNNGYWPAALNDYEAVKASINLDQLLVSLSGTSNADANSVYAQKVYDYRDINIGYRYVNMLYRDETSGNMQVDIKVINDVVEQVGGGGEPFHISEPHPLSDILVL